MRIGRSWADSGLSLAALVLGKAGEEIQPWDESAAVGWMVAQPVTTEEAASEL